MDRHEIVTLSVAVQSAWKVVTRLGWEIEPEEFIPLADSWLNEWRDAGQDYGPHALGILERVTAIVVRARDTRVNDEYDAIRTCEHLSWTLRGVLDTLDALRQSGVAQ